MEMYSNMTTNYNLNAHYTSNPKVERPQRAIVSAPNNLPVMHLYNDRDANNRMKSINNDIYQGFKQEKQKDLKIEYSKKRTVGDAGPYTNFLKGFVAVILGILTFLGIKKVFK